MEGSTSEKIDTEQHGTVHMDSCQEAVLSSHSVGPRSSWQVPLATEQSLLALWELFFEELWLIEEGEDSSRIGQDRGHTRSLLISSSKVLQELNGKGSFPAAVA